MLESPDTARQEPSSDESVQQLRERIDRMQAELVFKRVKIEALNFETARLKRWRFGASSESLESGQAVLFDHILVAARVKPLVASSSSHRLPIAARDRSVDDLLSFRVEGGGGDVRPVACCA
jgi:hypothetical protein